jgi:hypothetical protein
MAKLSPAENYGALSASSAKSGYSVIFGVVPQY